MSMSRDWFNMSCLRWCNEGTMRECSFSLMKPRSVSQVIHERLGVVQIHLSQCANDAIVVLLAQLEIQVVISSHIDFRSQIVNHLRS